MKVSRKARFVTATVVWLAVSIMLIYRGLVPHFSNIDSTTTKAIFLGIAVVIGFGKGMFVISKSTARTAGFIMRRPEKDWIWMSFHPVLYILIPAMIGLGMFLRGQFAATRPEIVVCVYVAVGLALLIGVRGFRKVIA